MTQHVMNGLVIVTGLIATAVGIVAAAGRLRAAGRAHRRIETLYASMPEGWSSWFLGGFSDVTLGARWLRALAVLVIWTLTGAWFIGLGLRAFWRT